MKKPLAIALVGAIVAAFAQRFTPTGWWLNSGRGVTITCLVLALLAVPVGAAALSWPLQPRSAVWPGALWAGANIGLAIVLFRVGPGNIFPIVLVVGAGISALAVGTGSLFGALPRAVWSWVGLKSRHTGH
jgi:hypothetical protein